MKRWAERLTAPLKAVHSRALHRRLALVAAIMLGSASAALLVASGSATAQQSNRTELSAAQVIAAFEAAELPAEGLQRDPAGQGGPSGPPTSEREGWSFTIPSVAPSGGRILVFGEESRLRQKVAWFRRAGAEGRITVHHNIVLWLDEELDAPVAARYQHALRELGR
jgi:hypothetical protein